MVAPVRERGLKYNSLKLLTHEPCRSREGAWIEIKIYIEYLLTNLVAPVRERGLKYKCRR